MNRSRRTRSVVASKLSGVAVEELGSGLVI
jgi:hypothetical protein